ncbi:MAG TPA: hypothetical protein VF520_13575 [Thermoleophilaceae bacterium]|jgi:hypothetical protein
MGRTGGRRLGAVLAIVLAFACVAAAGCSADDAGDADDTTADREAELRSLEGGFAFMVVGRLAADGTFEACVRDQHAQGLPLSASTRSCRSSYGRLPAPGSGRTGLTIDTGDPKVAAPACQAASSDPRAEAAGAPTPGEKGLNEAATVARKAATAAFNKELEREKEYRRARDAAKAARDAVAVAEAEARAAEAKAEAARLELAAAKLRTKVAEEHRVRTEEARAHWVPPSHRGPLQRPSGDTGADTCQSMARLVDECNRGGWRSPTCVSLLDRLRGCADRSHTDPLPEGPEAVNCKDQVKHADVKRAAEAGAAVCRARTRPAPGEDPCVDPHATGSVSYFRFGNPGGPPCDDPRAMPGADQCLGTFTFVHFDGLNLDRIVEQGMKLGGPGITLLIPKPRPPGSHGPQPETGGPRG